MGKRKRFRAAEKTVQKMSRDGLLSENKATGEVTRISPRTVDTSLHLSDREHDFSPKHHAADMKTKSHRNAKHTAGMAEPTATTVQTDFLNPPDRQPDEEVCTNSKAFAQPYSTLESEKTIFHVEEPCSTTSEPTASDGQPEVYPTESPISESSTPAAPHQPAVTSAYLHSEVYFHVTHHQSTLSSAFHESHPEQDSPAVRRKVHPQNQEEYTSASSAQSVLRNHQSPSLPYYNVENSDSAERIPTDNGIDYHHRLEPALQADNLQEHREARPAEHHSFTERPATSNLDIPTDAPPLSHFKPSKKESLPKTAVDLVSRVSSETNHPGQMDKPEMLQDQKPKSSTSFTRKEYRVKPPPAATASLPVSDDIQTDNGIDLTHRQDKITFDTTAERHMNLTDAKSPDVPAQRARKDTLTAKQPSHQHLHRSKTSDLKAGEQSKTEAPEESKTTQIPSRNPKKEQRNPHKDGKKPDSTETKQSSDAASTTSGKKRTRLQSEQSTKKKASRLKMESSDLSGKSSMTGTIKEVAGKGIRLTTSQAGAFVHGKVNQVEHENAAVEGAHRTEILAERGIREVRNLQNSSKKKRASEKKSRLHEAQESSRFKNGDPAPVKKPDEEKKSLMNRFYQKLHNKKQAMEAAKAAKRGSKTAESAGSVTEKAVLTIKNVFRDNKKTIGIVLAILLVFLMLITQLQSCSVIVTQSLASISATSWPADDKELTAADLYYTQLETNLQQKIDSMESAYPGYDEYNYNVGEIGHDPFVLLSYLCAKYGDFRFANIQSELDALFTQQYHLRIERKTEQRTVTKTVQAGQSLGTVTTSGYCNCSLCCGQWAGGPTASGVYPTANHTLAVDANDPIVPIGTEIIMNGTLYKVEDTGNFSRYGVDFDVYYDNHSAAWAHGHKQWEAYYAGGSGNSVQITTTESVRICNITLTSTNLSTVIASRMNDDQREVYQIYLSSRGNRQFLGTPIACNWYGNISSHYGYRISPTSGSLQLHRGLDIAVPQGTELLAVHDGIVTTATYDSSFGNYIVIQNSDGYTTKYAHCSALLVSVGQTVSTGDVIAKAGSTGNSTGSHLHIEFLYQGEYLNPYFYLSVGEGSVYGNGFGFTGDVDALDDATFAALIHEAEKYLGMAYVWGGSSPSTGFDCSGFVSYVFTNSGVYNMGRLTAQGIYDICSPVNPADARPGDIIFFTGTYNSPGPVSHVGIYVGNGQMIHCGDPIQYTSINTAYWQNHFYAFGRPG